MRIIGCDFHTRQQQIAMLDTETGEMGERELQHENGEARKFYERLPKPVRVGIEATGYTLWFEKMLAELGHELWMGDAAKIRAAVVRKQKSDKQDAAHILKLLVEDRFPRIWMPTPAERDLRQPGAVPEEEVVEPGGPCGTGSAVVGAVGIAAATRVAGDARSVGETDRGAGSRGGTASGGSRGSGSLDDASGRGTVNLAGIRPDGGGGRSISARPAGEQLSGAGSAHGTLGRACAERADQQAGEFGNALVAGGSRAYGGTERSGTAAGVSAVEVPPRESDCQSGGGAPLGREVVLDAAQSGRLRRTDGAGGSHAG
jgi:hypothetical protein